jgi:hypothetical protein
MCAECSAGASAFPAAPGGISAAPASVPQGDSELVIGAIVELARAACWRVEAQRGCLVRCAPGVGNLYSCAPARWRHWLSLLI